MNSESRMADGILTCTSFPRASYLIQCEVLNLTRARKTHNSTLLTLPVPLSSPVTVCFQQPQTRCSISWYGRRFFSLWESAQLSHLLVGVLVWISLLEHTLSDMIFLLHSVHFVFHTVLLLSDPIFIVSFILLAFSPLQDEGFTHACLSFLVPCS